MDGSRSDWSLATDQIDANRLVTFVEERTEHRVGHYFENLIHFWLKHIRGVEIIAHRQPVRDEERTLGELDFVFRDEAGRLNHWEVAVKFYLQTTSNDGHPKYLGPNTNDSLERKLERMRNHQLPLSGRIYNDVEIRQAFVKGWLFQPTGIDLALDVEMLNPGHLRGGWMHAGEIDGKGGFDGRAQAFSVMKKPFWLTPERPYRSMDEFADCARDHFAKRTTAMHVALFDEAREETRRLFVVRDGWPHVNDPRVG